MLAFVFIFIVFTGCVGIPHEMPDIPVPEKYQHAGDFTGEFRDRWWEDFNSKGINNLVQSIIEQNHDIRIATEHILQARASLGVVRSSLFPSLDASMNMNRQREGIITNTINTSLAASYEIDLWERLRSSERAERYALLEAEENRHTVVQSIIAEAVSLYLQKEGVKRKIEIAKDRVENARKTLAMVESRYRAGLTAYLDLIEARGSLADSKAVIPLLYQDLYDLQQRLALLTSEYPETRDNKVSSNTDYIKRLRPVPAGLPSELLRRRPDIRAAEARMKRMYELLKSARAARFPSITLTASYGWASSSLSTLFRPENKLWQIASGIIEPIFDAGRLKLQEESALSRYREAIISYSKTVLNAFYEVERALLNRKLLFDRREQLLRILENVQEEEKTATAQYIKGLTDLVTVLRAKDRRFSVEENLADVDTSILLNRVSLYRALGGGWQFIEQEGAGRDEKGYK